MKIVTSKLRARVFEARIADWPRILPSRRRSTPASAGFGSSRLSSPSGAFRVLYAADNFPTAFAEAVVRDRFEGKTRHFLYHADGITASRALPQAQQAASARRMG
ncbi:RES domain-containing protein [Bradyrhizobium sp.]|uniref:RES domain-containing protein n=1 Tax=Bradyrhizobium sp. TaxID=376 RepID=UPI003C6EB60B